MKRKLSLLALATLVLIAASYAFTPVEQFRLQSPDGRHTAIVSSLRIWQWLPRLPGQGGDKPGRVAIVTSQGELLGDIPLPHISMANNIEWLQHGARIKLVGAWNFHDGFYAYWNGDLSKLEFHSIN